MKLNKLGKSMKEGRREVTLLTDPECQLWVRIKDAAYAAEPELGLTRENLLAIVDIDKDKRNRYSVREGMTKDTRFSIYYDNEAEDPNRLHVLALFDHTLLLADPEGAILGIDARLLSPIESENGNAFYIRYSHQQREGEETPLVAVFDDILCGALIMPIPREQLEKLMDLCRDVSKRRTIMPIHADEGEQLSLLEE